MKPTAFFGIVSKLEDHIYGERELVLARATIVSVGLISSFESQFRPEQHGRANPMSPHQGVFRIQRLETGPLTFKVIQQVGAQ